MTDAGALGPLAERIAAGDPRAMARGVTLVEEGRAAELMPHLVGRGGRARVVGLTGPPGAGKSTLLERLARLWSDAGLRVAIVAVDPTSPYTGGALLGDRIRMQSLAGSTGVFIRSMATRGALGGLSGATADAIAVLDAAGVDVVAVETVGVGQDEVDVALVADTVVVVLVPGLGDEIQALKAGLLEVGDLFVVHKADLPGAPRAAAELASVLQMAPGPVPEVILAAAETGQGIVEVRDAIDRHAARLAAVEDGDPGSLRLRRRRQAAERLRRTLASLLMARVDREILGGVGTDVLDDLAARRADPHALADKLLARWPC